VVKGTNPKTSHNHCRFQVSLDELFFRAPEMKTGLIVDKNWPYKDGVVWAEPKQVPLADKFDLRDLMKGASRSLKLKTAETVWAWATHHGLEIARAVHDGKAYDLSVQSVLSCSGAGSCNGGTMEAVDFLKHALPMETDFPYEGYDASCKYSDSEIQTGWEAKIIAAPYVGKSLRFSRAMRNRDGSFREGNKIQEMMAAMAQWQSPLVVTVSAYSISGPGIYDSCSDINSDGDHMVAVVGWDEEGGSRNAHVWNSWGQKHGDHGVSRIKWECGENELNRGLGQAARIVQYKLPCTPPNPQQDGMHEILAGSSVQIGAAQPDGVKCSWMPTDGLMDPTACLATARPAKTTEYHLTATSDCGTTSSMTMVDVWGPSAKRARPSLPPLGRLLGKSKRARLHRAMGGWPDQHARETMGWTFYLDPAHLVHRRFEPEHYPRFKVRTDPSSRPTVSLPVISISVETHRLLDCVFLG